MWPIASSAATLHSVKPPNRSPPSQQSQASAQRRAVSVLALEVFLEEIDELDELERSVDDVMAEASEFLRQNKESLHKETTIQLLASHGRNDLLLEFWCGL